MTPAHAQAMAVIVDTQEKLQKVWNTPRRFKMPGPSNLHPHREVFVTMCIVEDESVLKWAASVRFYNSKKKKLRTVTMWTPSEKEIATKILNSELEGVGDETTDDAFESLLSAQLYRNLTPLERDELLRPHILGSDGNRINPPTIINSQKGADDLLTKLEKELVEREPSRIIRPGNNGYLN